MTLQDTTTKPQPTEKLRATGAAFVDNVIEPAMDELSEAAAKAGNAASDMARNVQHRAGKLGEAAAERGSEIASDLSDAASRNLHAAETGLRDFARRNPELLIAGAALLGMGLATWLRSSQSGSSK
jgi:vacuolar-type H+-ATPase subunit H